MNDTWRRILSVLILATLVIGLFALSAQVPQIQETYKNLETKASSNWDDVSNRVRETFASEDGNPSNSSVTNSGGSN